MSKATDLKKKEFGFFMDCPRIYIHTYTVGYVRTNVIGSRTSFVITSVRACI